MFCIKIKTILDINFLAVYNSIAKIKINRGNENEKRYTSGIQENSYKMCMRK